MKNRRSIFAGRTSAIITVLCVLFVIGWLAYLVFTGEDWNPFEVRSWLGVWF